MSEPTSVLPPDRDLLDVLPHATPRDPWAGDTPEQDEAWQVFIRSSEHAVIEPDPFLDDIPSSLPRRRAADARAATTGARRTTDDVAAADETTGETVAAEPAPTRPRFATRRAREQLVGCLCIAAAVMIGMVGFANRARGEVVAPPVASPATELATTTAPSAPPTTAAPAPAETTTSVTDDAQSRQAFLRSMGALGLTEDQAACATAKIEATVTWSALAETSFTPEGAQHLREVIRGCVLGG